MPRPEAEFTILADECKNGKFLTPGRSCQDRDACWPPYVNRRYPKVGSLNESRMDDGLIGGVCAECPDDCNQCELWDKCTECRHTKYLTPDDHCNSTCPETHYPHNPKENDTDSSVGRICVACEGNCSHCVTKTELWTNSACARFAVLEACAQAFTCDVYLQSSAIQGMYPVQEWSAPNAQGRVQFGMS